MIHISIRKSTVAIVASVLAVVVIFLILLYASVPRLPKWEKKKVEEAYFEESELPIVWYDEIGYEEKNLVFRYLGMYGDCYAFLRIGDNDNAIWEEVELPYPLSGLSRTVYYPIEADVILYHTKSTFTYEDAYGMKGMEKACGVGYLEALENREEWISDELLEKLTQDIEEIAREHN